MANKTANEIKSWLITQVADRLEIDESKLDVNQPLTEAGLSSREAIMLTGDMEDFLGFDLPPELFYDHPRIDDLASLLSKGPNALDEDSVDDVVADKYSDEEPKSELSSFLMQRNSLIDLMRERVALHPDRDAFVYLLDGETEHERITYKGLHERAKSIAAHLQSKSLRGERILLLHPSSIDFIAGFMGCVYAGAIAVPAFPPVKRRGLERIASIVEDSTAKAALLSTDLLEKLRGSSRFDKEKTFPGVEWVLSDTIDNNLANQWSEPSNINRDTIGFLQYTSGSTGSPKGVMVTHGNIIHNSMLIAEISEIKKVDAITPSVSWLPMYHDMGMIGNILYQMATGYTNYFMEPNTFLQKPIKWLQAIGKYGAQHTASPNFAFDHCLERIDPNELNGLDLSQWKLAINGAEPVRAATLKNFTEMFAPYGFKAETFSPSFGMAEATLIVTSVPMDETAKIMYLDSKALESDKIKQIDQGDSSAVTKVSCGFPLMDMAIADHINKTALGENQVGEIWLKGESVAKGYWQRKEETEITFGAYLTDTGNGPYMRTGDLGFVHNGELYFTGRIKDLIIIRGSNHYPQDIELSVQESHDVLVTDGAAAFSVDAHGSERLVVLAEVQRTAVRSLDEEEIMEAVRTAISQEHNLQVYAIALLTPGKLPRTTSGKTQRRQAKLLFLDDSLEEIVKWKLPIQDMPENDKTQQIDLSQLRNMRPELQKAMISQYLQETIAHMLRLPVSEVPADKPLVNLGLDSMHAVELKGKMEKYLNADIDMMQFLQGADIETLTAKVIDLIHRQYANGAALNGSVDLSNLDNMTNDQIQSLVDRMDDLSDEQVELLLAKLG